MPWTGSTAEISGLWSAIEKSVQVIRGAREKAAAMHRVAAYIPPPVVFCLFWPPPA